jgi:hypothetical protein
MTKRKIIQIFYPWYETNLKESSDYLKSKYNL